MTPKDNKEVIAKPSLFEKIRNRTKDKNSLNQENYVDIATLHATLHSGMRTQNFNK
jgi:hypothetical protein